VKNKSPEVVQITLYIPIDLKKEILKRAREKGETMSAEIRATLREKYAKKTHIPNSQNHS